MSAIAAIVTIDVPEDRVDDLLAVLGEMARSAKGDAGTDVWDVCADAKTPGRFYLYERYRDRDAFRTHRANTTLAELGGRLTALADRLDITRLDVVDGPDQA